MNRNSNATADIDNVWDAIVLESHPTIKMQQVTCYRYVGVEFRNVYNEVVVGDVVTYLTIEAYCLLHNYVLVSGGIALYCDPCTNTRLTKQVSSQAA